MNEYHPVPVETARKIAADFDKTIVVVVTLDVSGRTHHTTYGRSAQDKLVAARCSEVIAERVFSHPVEDLLTHEDFRLMDLAQVKARKDELEHILRRLVELHDEEPSMLTSLDWCEARKVLSVAD